MGIREMIGLDWGTSALRAWRLDRRGAVLERREFDLGIQRVRDGRFDEAFRTACGDWIARAPETPVLASGMIGSRQGWVEAPYVDTPAGFDDLTRGFARAVAADGTQVRIVPGVATRLADGVHDVMRGEETQVAGALARLATDDADLVLPGTHSKWVRVRAGRIEAFRTYMTGELYAVLSAHSILGRLFPPPGEAPPGDAGSIAARDAAFADGLRRSAVDPAGLAASLFSVRAEGLFGAFPAHALPSYLSGLLIGAEVAHATTALPPASGAPALESDTPARAIVASPALAIVASPALAAPYQRACVAAGLAARVVDGEPAADGLWRIAVAAGLVAP